MPFKGGTRSGPGPESPEALYRDLPRRRGATPGLWTHQGDILRASLPAFWTTYDPEVVRAALKRLDAAQTP